MQIEIAYAIGVAHPVSVFVETFGTGIMEDIALSKLVLEHFDLRRPIYLQTAAYGHFGRSDLDLPWERLDMVEKLK